MKNKLKDVKPYIFKAYLENMREYCNKYDNIAILNQVKAFVGDENVALSDVYADFALVSKEEYDRGNRKKRIETIVERILRARRVNEGLEQRIEDTYNNIKINGMVVLSEPGGGKTTYLKHLIFQLLSDENEIFDKIGLDENVSYIPFFVRTRDITDILDNSRTQEEKIFEDIIKDSISSILGNTITDTDTEIANFTRYLFCKDSEYRKLLVIDGFEELNDSQAQKLLDCIDRAYKDAAISKSDDKLIISSRYKEYGYQKLANYCKSNSIEEKYIIFDDKNNAIDTCVSKWFEILEKNGGDNYAYFNKMRASNSDIGRIITTPLELTGLIMLCQSQSVLPTDIPSLYRLIIEIWLTYGIQDTSIPFFSLSDIFLELSAMHMELWQIQN